MVGILFQTFEIGGPFTLTDSGTAGADTGAATGTAQFVDAVGHCRDDTFVVSSTARGSPIICGQNTGQHSK